MTAPQGHNGPPEHIAHSLSIEDLFELASTSTTSAITTNDQEQALDTLLDDLRKARKAADEQRAVEKKPHDLAAKEVQALWLPLLSRCDMATAKIKDRLTPFRMARQAEKDEAARIARDEAEAKQRAAQEALRKSDDLEERFAAEEQLKQASKLTAAANKIDRSASGLRSHQVADVDNYGALLAHIKSNDPDALKAWLDGYAQKALPAQLPGVTIRIEKRAA